MVTLTAPYVAGFLAFRETPFLLDCLTRLQKNRPDLLPQVQNLCARLQSSFSFSWVGFLSEGEGEPSSSSMLSSPQVVFVDGNGLFHYRGTLNSLGSLSSILQMFHRRTKPLCLM